MRNADLILEKIGVQAERMSLGYDRHGFERGKKTHFKARPGKLFETDGDDPTHENIVDAKTDKP